MFTTFVITLREGIEAFLIVAISLAYLRKTGRSHLAPAVYWGIAVALVASAVAGYFFGQAENKPLWEGLLAAVTAVLVASLTIHMWRAARTIKHAIGAKLEAAATQSNSAAFAGVFLFTVLAITREGMETALLITTQLFQEGGQALVIGCLLGVSAAGIVAWLWSHFGHRVNLARFFQVTAVFLLIFVVQLAIYAFHELTEANVLPIDNEYWHIATEPYGPEGQYGQAITYALVLLPLAWLVVATLKERLTKQPALHTS
jgi:high-affinity iron transporter